MSPNAADRFLYVGLAIHFNRNIMRVLLLIHSNRFTRTGQLTIGKKISPSIYSYLQLASFTEPVPKSLEAEGLDLCLYALYIVLVPHDWITA